MFDPKKREALNALRDLFNRMRAGHIKDVDWKGHGDAEHLVLTLGDGRRLRVAATLVDSE